MDATGKPMTAPPTYAPPTRTVLVNGARFFPHEGDEWDCWNIEDPWMPAAADNAECQPCAGEDLEEFGCRHCQEIGVYAGLATPTVRSGASTPTSEQKQPRRPRPSRSPDLLVEECHERLEPGWRQGPVPSAGRVQGVCHAAAVGLDGHAVPIPSKFRVEPKDDTETEDDEVAHDTEDDDTGTEEGACSPDPTVPVDPAFLPFGAKRRLFEEPAHASCEPAPKAATPSRARTRSRGIWTKISAWCSTRGVASSPLPNEVEICATEAEDSVAAGIVQVNPDITVDSGAGASVANQAHFPHCLVEPSPGSEGGQTFIGASGASMPNRGQIKPKLILETGGMGTFKFQETTVRKPLLAVSDVNNKGNLVLFDGHNSFILQPSDEVEEIRKLVRKASKKVPLHLENGTFKIKAWQPEGPFGRLGR